MNFQDSAIRNRRHIIKRRWFSPTLLQYFQIGALSALMFFLVCWGLAGLEIRKTSASARDDLHSTSGTLNVAITAIQADVDHLYFLLTDKTYGTLPLVNANLIHADLVLGDAQRVSDLQEAYWKNFSVKSLLAMDNANNLLVSLKTTSDGLHTDSGRIADAVVDATTNGAKPALVAVADAAKATTGVATQASKDLSDPSIPAALNNIADGTKQFAAAGKSIANSADTVDKKVTKLANPSLAGKIEAYAMFGIDLAKDIIETRYYLESTAAAPVIQGIKRLFRSTPTP